MHPAPPGVEGDAAPRRIHRLAAIGVTAGQARDAGYPSPRNVSRCCRGTKRPVPGFDSTSRPSQMRVPRR